MASLSENTRKRKQTTTGPEIVVSSDDDQSKSKARRVSTDASASIAALLQVDTPVVTERVTTANASSKGSGESLQCIGKMIQDLIHSDNAKVNAALDALNLNLDGAKKKCEKKCDKIRAVGGCFVLFHLMNKCLDEAIDIMPACDRVTELYELDALVILDKTLRLITNLTFNQYDRKVEMADIGVMEAAIKVMQTFPNCQSLQVCACGTLASLVRNNTSSKANAIESSGVELLLAAVNKHLNSAIVCENASNALANIVSGGKESRIGKANAIKSGGIEILLAAINKHLDSPAVCENACRALRSIVSGSKENTEVLITLGGGATVAKVSRKWPDNVKVQLQVQILVDICAAGWKAWGRRG
jgi:hypothetical protein